MRAWKLILVALGIGLALVATWLVREPRSRPGDFVDRRGNLQHAELGALVEEPGGFISQDVRLTSDTGLQVALKVLRPAGESGPRPLAVLLGGHRTGATR